MMFSALFAATALAERPRVLVVKSSGLSAYTQVVAGFGAELMGRIEELTLPEGPEGAALLRKTASNKPALVLAIGPLAAVTARRELSEVPVLFCMVPYYERYELDGQNVTGIALTIDLSLELAALKAIAPKVKRVGVLQDPRHSKELVEDAEKAAQSQGLTLIPINLENASRIEPVLAAAKGKIDALLMVGDKTVANAAVVERLLNWSQEEKRPAIGFAAAQVRQGALFALAAAPLATGQQAGRLANRILMEKVNPGAMAVASPDGLELHLNLTTAKRLGALENFARDALSFAGQQELTVKVAQ